MENELRDPHDPVIPGEHVHPPEGNGGVSMPIGVSGDLADPNAHVGPGAPVVDTVPHIDEPPSPKLDEQLAETSSADSGTEAQVTASDVPSES